MSGVFRQVPGREEGDRPARSAAAEGRGNPLARATRPVFVGKVRHAPLYFLA